MVVTMLLNWSYKYYSHYSIIKFIGFKMIYYTINMSAVFINLLFVFLSVAYLWGWALMMWPTISSSLKLK